MSQDQQYEYSFARPGAVHYMEAPALRRGLRMSRSTKLAILLFGIAALLFATLFGMKAYDNIVNGPAHYAESVRDVIQNGPGLQLPLLSSYTESSAQDIRTSLEETGFKIIDANAVFADEGDEAEEGTLDLVKVPATMDTEQATLIFKNGLRRVSLLDAATYLAGSWRFSSSSVSGIDFKVKYADLQSESMEQAIANAISAQGWSDSTFGETGIDQSGNTYQEGTIEINDRVLHWTVSACTLDEVYDINGLPENAFYIGARLVS